MPSSTSLSAEKKRWWVSNRKTVERYVKDARALLAAQNPSHVSAALGLLDAALAISPRFDAALELRARSLLFLRRFRDVADMLQSYIPSFQPAGAELDDSAASLSSDSSNASSSSSSSSSQQLSRERLKLLPSSSPNEGCVFRCFSVSDLKRRILAGLWRNGEQEGQWRYIVLGQACLHLGMMEDAMALLQTGRRLATVASRRESRCLPDDSFSFCNTVADHASTAHGSAAPAAAAISAGPAHPESTAPPTDMESAGHLLTHVKLLLRRHAAAVSALDAGLPTESARHFSKILDGCRGIPHAFAASCLVGRAAAYRAAGRVAESIADYNRALALDPASIPALRARADLLESLGSFSDCLRDLDHLKLLYDAILLDGKLPGPAWRPHHGVRFRDITGDLRALSSKIQELRQMSSRCGEACNVDYYALIGVRRGCTRSELERAHLLLSLKHQPDKAAAFVDRLEFADEHRDIDAVRDQARMSALMLYRLLQKGYASIMSAVMDDEATEKQRLRAVASPQTAGPATGQAPAQAPEKPNGWVDAGREQVAPAACPLGSSVAPMSSSETKAAAAAAASVFPGVFCRDLAAVGNLLSQVGFNQTIPVKYEALRC